MSRFPLANTNKESLKQCEQIEKRHVYGKKKQTMGQNMTGHTGLLRNVFPA